MSKQQYLVSLFIVWICIIILWFLLFTYWKYLLYFLGLLFTFALCTYIFILIHGLFKYYIFRFYGKDIRRGLITVFKILISLIYIAIFCTVVVVIFLSGINYYFGNNIFSSIGELFTILFYSFQILIVGIGILVGYLNYKELIRKNQGDHFPKISVLKNSITTGIYNLDKNFKPKKRSKTVKKDKNEGCLIIRFILENLSENIVELKSDRLNIVGYIKGKGTRKESFFTGKNRYIDRLMKLRYFRLNLDGNIFYSKGKKHIEIELYMIHLQKFSFVKELELTISISSYGIKKELVILLTNYTRGGYDFTIHSSKYL